MKKGYRYNKKVLEQIKKANEKAGNKDKIQQTKWKWKR